MALLLLRNAPLKEEHGSALARWLQNGYQAMLARLIPVPRWSYVMVGVIFLAGGAMLPQRGDALLPSCKERDFLMRWLTTPGTSHPEMYRITVQSCRELM